MADEQWFDDYAGEEDEDFQIEEYDLTATPNDFNVITINNFIESGAVKIPGFQRNFVWDIKRASKLIESLILGLPVPQIFLYEESRNRFLVIDGQQRLMSIYYFIKQRFPRKERRVELRRIFDDKGDIPKEVLHDDAYFTPFNLSLWNRIPEGSNKFRGLNYSTLGDYRTQLDLRPVRNVVVKQANPPDDDSSIFEIFNRLNTGGINLRPQEIRASLYHSEFMEMTTRVNLQPKWRDLLQLPDPDLHMKDVEVLLRGFSMLVLGAEYGGSMKKFLNTFCKKCKANNSEKNGYLEQLFVTFLAACDGLPKGIFSSSRTKRFSIALFEATFTAVCETPFRSRALVTTKLTPDKIRSLDSDQEFITATEKASTHTSNVETRLRRARVIFG